MNSHSLYGGEYTQPSVSPLWTACPGRESASDIGRAVADGIRGAPRAWPENKSPPWVAIGKQFHHCREVITLGVRPSFTDYEPWVRELLLSGRTIYFPTHRFIDLFHSLEIPTYPSWHYYRYVGDKFRQTQLFQALGIPHPRTRFYQGCRQQKEITRDFRFPFIAKIGKGSCRGKGVFLIRSQSELETYCMKNRRAYIQEFIPERRTVRVVLLKGHVIHAYWRIAPPGSHLSNLHQGGMLSLAPVPEGILEFARMAALKCRFDEVGLDIIPVGDLCYILEANMAFGTRGLDAAGIDLRRIRQDMLMQGLI